MSTILTKNDINRRCLEIAKEIEFHYKDRSEIVLLCTLKGALPFFFKVQSKLNKVINDKITWSFISVSSYHNNKQIDSINIENVRNLDLKNKTVIIFEDIVDSGNTLSALLNNIIVHCKPEEICFVTLISRINLDKYLKVPSVKRIIIGKEIKEEGFLVGFGLDDNQKMRYLDQIYIKTSK